MKVLILDLSCPKPYNTEMLQLEGMGGSEASLIRISEGLIKAGVDVRIAQHNREAQDKQYYPLDLINGKDWKPDVVVHFRTAATVPAIRKRFPASRELLLLTDVFSPEMLKDIPQLNEKPTTIVCLSRWHAQHTSSVLLSSYDMKSLENLGVRAIYLPIDDDLMPDNTPVIQNKLVFFSSPIKGFHETIELFTWLRQVDKDWELHICNPGYIQIGDPENIPESVVNHGVLTHKQAVDITRSAFAVFYGNKTFPETQGLVFSEANAVGTPVLAYWLGAAAEMLGGGDSFQIVKEKDNWKQYIDRLLQWKKHGRPELVPQPSQEVRLKKVVEHWIALFNRVT